MKTRLISLTTWNWSKAESSLQWPSAKTTLTCFCNFGIEKGKVKTVLFGDMISIILKDAHERYSFSVYAILPEILLYALHLLPQEQTKWHEIKSSFTKDDWWSLVGQLNLVTAMTLISSEFCCKTISNVTTAESQRRTLNFYVKGNKTVRI